MHESIKPPRRRVHSPWVWAATALLAAVLLGASALHFATASCAVVTGPPSAPAPSAPAPSSSGVTAGRATTGRVTTGGVTTGRAYFYDPGDGVGSCSFGPLPADGRYVSLSAPQYANGAPCGSYLDVTGPDGSVQAEVVDLCSGCADGGLDLSEAAFGQVASLGDGTAEVSYHLVRDPRPVRPLEVRIAPSASASWLAVQVLGNGNPLSSVAVAPDRPHSPAGARGPARWQRLALSSDDYWAAPAGAGAGPFMMRITDVFGHRAVADGIRLLPGSVQRTRVAMYAAAAVRHAPADPATPALQPKPALGKTVPRRAGGWAAGAATPRAYPGRSGSGPHC